MDTNRISLKNLEDLQRFAEQEAKNLSCRLFLLSGELGAGKTTFSQNFIRYLRPQAGAIQSPTFSYLNVYPGDPPIYHFDLYRMERVDEVFDLGLWEFLGDEKAIRIVEWPEIVLPILQEQYRHITFFQEADERFASIKS